MFCVQPFASFCVCFMASVAELERAVAELERAAELERERTERVSMHAAGLESRIAERMFLFDPRLPNQGEPLTYERMYTMRHNALLDAHASLGRVRRLLQQQRVSRAMEVLDEELGSDEPDEQSEEESLDDDEPVNAPVQAVEAIEAIGDLQQTLLAQITPAAAAAPPAFTGRSFRLDD